MAAHTWKNDRDSVTKAAPAGRFSEPHPSWNFSRIPVHPPDQQQAMALAPARNQIKSDAGVASNTSEAFSSLGQPLAVGSGELAARYFPPASTGHRLGGGTPAGMQARFGVPAADVMIHADPAAAAIADRLNASAFTVGRHVVFGTGRFDPASARGQMLLAHEIAHVVQQCGANSGRWAASPEAELEASEAAASAVLGWPTPALSATPVGVACQGKEEEQTWRSRLWHSGTALVEKAKVKARDYIKEQVGVVEGVANEAATFVDTVIWADSSVSDLTDKVVDKVAVVGGLSKEKHEALRSAVQTFTNQPGMTALREAVRKAARKADLVDPVTGAPSTARAVGRAFDWVEKKSDETLFRGMPKEEGLLSSRDIGVLEGSIGSQIALAFTGGEEVQLALKALGAVQSVEGIVTAIQAARLAGKPDSWQSDLNFWTQVVNLALFMVGLRSASVGKKILSIVLESASTLLTAIPAVMQLARDVRATGPDRDERIRADIKALIKALAQAIQQIIMHARGTKPARAGGAAEGTPASPVPAETTPSVPAARPHRHPRPPPKSQPQPPHPSPPRPPRPSRRRRPHRHPRPPPKSQPQPPHPSPPRPPRPSRRRRPHRHPRPPPKSQPQPPHPSPPRPPRPSRRRRPHRHPRPPPKSQPQPPHPSPPRPPLRHLYPQAPQRCTGSRTESPEATKPAAPKQSKELSPEQELKKLIAEQAADRAQGDVGLTDVEPGSQNLHELPEYQESIARASDEFSRLPDIENKKNVAGSPSGGPALSGFAGEKIAPTERAQVEGAEAGHETEPHPFDPKGAEGQYENSHSERHKAAGTSDQEFASAKLMCPACQRWFSARAGLENRPQFVADPSGVHIFMPNGSHSVVPHPSGAVTMQ